MPLSAVSPPVFVRFERWQTTEKWPGADRGGIIERSAVSNVTSPTASRWPIIRYASDAASRRACSNFETVRPA